MGNLAIAAGFPERNGQQRAPDLLLELSTGKVQLQIKAVAVTGKVLLELVFGFLQNRAVDIFLQRADAYPVELFVFPENGAELVALGYQGEGADR
ncbi:hypothetical protein D3C73_1539230 [compost metagenome]